MLHVAMGLSWIETTKWPEIRLACRVNRPVSEFLFLFARGIEFGACHEVPFLEFGLWPIQVITPKQFDRKLSESLRD
jgi:hypothetical protein